jgi:HAD superfamily hydrolase (TIGR01459 family)
MLPGSAYKLGPDKDEMLYKGLDIRFAPLEESDFIVCTGLVDDARETPDDYGELLTRAAQRDLAMICANPDVVVRWGGRLVYCAGALAEAYERLGGRVIYGGKPHPPIYNLALLRFEAVAGRPIDRRRVLAIGDGVKTDIAGANMNRLDALFVAGEGGVHVGGTDEGAILDALSRAGVRAEFVSKGLFW